METQRFFQGAACSYSLYRDRDSDCLTRILNVVEAFFLGLCKCYKVQQAEAIALLSMCHDDESMTFVRELHSRGIYGERPNATTTSQDGLPLSWDADDSAAEGRVRSHVRADPTSMEGERPNDSPPDLIADVSVAVAVPAAVREDDSASTISIGGDDSAGEGGLRCRVRAGSTSVAEEMPSVFPPDLTADMFAAVAVPAAVAEDDSAGSVSIGGDDSELLATDGGDRSSTDDSFASAVPEEAEPSTGLTQGSLGEAASSVYSDEAFTGNVMEQFRARIDNSAYYQSALEILGDDNDDGVVEGFDNVQLDGATQLLWECLSYRLAAEFAKDKNAIMAIFDQAEESRLGQITHIRSLRKRHVMRNQRGRYDYSLSLRNDTRMFMLVLYYLGQRLSDVGQRDNIFGSLYADIKANRDIDASFKLSDVRRGLCLDMWGDELRALSDLLEITGDSET